MTAATAQLLDRDDWHRASSARLAHTSGVLMIFEADRPMSDGEFGQVFAHAFEGLSPSRNDDFLLGRLLPDQAALYIHCQVRVVARILRCRWAERLAGLGLDLLIGVDGQERGNRVSLDELLIGARLDLIVQRHHLR